MRKSLIRIFITLILCQSTLSYAQFSPSEDPFAIEEDDLNIGGDIFNDFNEDVEESSVVEDERFYRYGRFFTFNLSVGMTTFQGNRGLVTQDDNPTYGVGVGYFSDFQSYYGLGFEYSKHHMFFDYPTNGCSAIACPDGFGLIDVSQLRFYFSYRYYVDTSNLGTAITYSNPYFIGRLEYWYTSNKFLDQKAKGTESGGGLGLGLGFGLEFPIKLRESYLGVEVLWHRINFTDKFTQEYRPCDAADSPKCGGGVDDLTGDPYTIMISYVMNW